MSDPTPGPAGAPADPPSGEVDATPEPGAAPEPTAERHRRRWPWIVGAVVLVVAGLAAWFAVSWGDTGAREASVSGARKRVASKTTVAPKAGELRPAQGVYRYRGSGTDKLETPSKTQDEGPDMPATVTHHPDGCWTFRIDYSSNHWQEWDYCPRNGGLDETGGRTYQKWDFVIFVNESTSVFACDSSVTVRAQQHPGDHWTQSCRSTTEPASATAGPYTYVGPETLTIGGTPVATYHYRRERTMTGGQTGTEQSEVWFAADTGLPVRNRRHLAVDTSTVVGAVRYVEDAEFELVSPDPAS